MTERRSLRDRFWATSNWPRWKQLLFAATLIVTVSLLLTAIVGNRSNGSAATESVGVPEQAVASSTTNADLPTSPTDVAIGAPTSNDPTAMSILATISVEREHRGGYDRDLFAVWLDLDGNGCDTRQEVLAAESTRSTGSGTPNCGSSAGDWYSVYDDTSTDDASTLDVDHVVPLKEAWDSGAWAWPPARRIAFANDVTDPRTLVAVSAESNRSKGDADPSNWLPAHHICRYLADWVSIKARWTLTMDESEFGRIKNLLRGQCSGITVAAWPTTPA